MSRGREYSQPRILTPKLRPPESRMQPVGRPRLLESLMARERYCLAVVAAPAGAGKTTLLSQFYHALEDRGVRAAWLSLDTYDDRLHRFLSGLAAALQMAAPSLGAQTRGILVNNPDPPVRDVLASLIDELIQFDQALVLILDDYHEIENREIHDALEFLVRYLPGKVNLVLGARSQPPLALSRYRLRGWLLEMNWNDLRFSDDETSVYLRDVQKLDLSDQQLDQLNARAEGWIAGLQLAAMSLRGGRDAGTFVNAVSGGQAAIADYLLEDVFERQSVEVRDFLLRTSVLDRLSAPLCNAVLEIEDSQRLLEELDQAGLFIFRLDQGRTIYRYHHLFSDFLFNRLCTEMPGEAQALSRRASSWYESQSRSFEALAYAVRGEWFNHAAELLAVNGMDLLFRGDFKELHHWIAELPAEVERERPRLCVLHGWALAYLGEFDEARRRIRWIREAGADGESASRLDAEIQVLKTVISVIQVDEPEDPFLDPDLPARFADEDHGLRALAHIMVAYACRARHRLDEALAHVEEAVRLSDGEDAPLVNMLARFNQGAVFNLMGRFVEAELNLRESLALAAERHWTRSMGMAFCRVQRAVALYGQYRLPDAMQELNQAIRLLETTRAFGFLGIAYTERGLVALKQGYLEAARDDAQRAGSVAQAHDVLRVRFRRALLEARIALAEDIPEQAENILAGYREQLFSGEMPDVLTENQELLLLAELAVLKEQGRGHDMIRLASHGASSAHAAGRTRTLVECVVFQALGWDHAGAHGKAADKLDQALSLGEAGRVASPFSLVPRSWLVAASKRGNAYATRLLDILARYGPGSASGAGGANQPELHPREVQILQLVAQGLRNKDIGERLFLSEETVKWYLKKLYQKLDVRSRTQAVTRARESGMIA